MATKNTAPHADEVPSFAATKTTVQDRIAAFAMLDGMGEATLAQKTVRLSLIGFAPGDIAAMLQTTPATVYQYAYEAKKKGGARKAKPKAKTAPNHT
jgi:DNA-directed RNA polymerase specialized sigma24 family protein